MKQVVALAVFFLAVSVTAQVEHAPTVAQCQADQRLWLAELEAEGGSKALPSFSEILAWGKEMQQCEDVDPDNRHKYYNTAGEINSEELVRLTHFIDRHNLSQEFMKEDLAGKR